MTPEEILRQLGELHVYPQTDWLEYVDYFDVADQVRSFGLAARAEGESAHLDGEVVGRIRQARGAVARNELGHCPSHPKIVEANELSQKKARSGMPLAIVSGAFDLLHLSHLRSMKRVRESLAAQRDVALCALTLPDWAIAEKKGADRPVLNVSERLALLAAVRLIDYVVLLDSPNCLSTLTQLRPEFLFKTEPDLSQAIVRQEIELQTSQGGQVRLLAEQEPPLYSSTKLIETVRRHHGEDEIRHPARP
jgi:bifunctional ADP-heptose synthase (sugar kinase/adenylyltransferase)